MVEGGDMDRIKTARKVQESEAGRTQNHRKRLKGGGVFLHENGPLPLRRWTVRSSNTVAFCF